MSTAPDDSRLARIEASLAHVEKLCEDLNGVVIGQARELEKLKAQTARLADSVETQELERIRDTNPKPPHY